MRLTPDKELNNLIHVMPVYKSSVSSGVVWYCATVAGWVSTMWWCIL